MAVTVIPNVTNWTVTPQNGQAGYFTLMNIWLGQSTSVIASLQTAITAQNTANNEINNLAIQTENNAIVATSLANYQGVWSSGTPYLKGQSVSVSGLYYISKIDSNLNHLVTDSDYWIPNPINNKVNNDMSGYAAKTTPVDADLLPVSDSESGFVIKKLSFSNLKTSLISFFMDLSTNQDIDGIKTFLKFPVTPQSSPLSNFEVSNKKYVDDNIENLKRSIIQYKSAHEIRISGGIMSFSGFRFKGQYQKKAKKTLFQNGSVIVSSASLPWGMTTRKQESWYAIFACANENDTNITYKCVPYMRIHSSTGTGSFYLSENTGEGKHVVGNTFSYGYNTSLINNRDVLICSETIDSRNNAMSGRVTKINSVGSNSVGFIDNGGIGALDYILIAPDFDHYRYCGSFYEDTAEIRNIADSGNIIVSKGIYQATYPSNGSSTTATSCSVAGYICPLATGVVLNDYFVMNNTSTGMVGTDFLIDNVHSIATFYIGKATTDVVLNSLQIIIPFSFKQEYYAMALGSISRTGEQHNICGWIEE